MPRRQEFLLTSSLYRFRETLLRRAKPDTVNPQLRVLQPSVDLEATSVGGGLATVLSRQGRFEEAADQFARTLDEQENGPDAPGGAAIEALIDRAVHDNRAGSFKHAAADKQLARDIALAARQR